jgi:hypothetical protein
MDRPRARGHDHPARRRAGRRRPAQLLPQRHLPHLHLPPDSGSVRYLVEWPGLSIDEKREGWILPCVAVPEGDVVVEQRLARRIAFD